MRSFGFRGPRGRLGRSLGTGYLVVFSAVALTTLFGAAGCDGDDGTQLVICTEEFRSLSVTVIDGTGAPVEDLDISVVRTRDGFTFDIGQDLAFNPGEYVIFDDGFKDEVTPAGEAIQVTATKDGVSVTGSYVIATDALGCHIEKVSGPDTLVWSVAP